MSPLMVVTVTQNTRHEYQDCDEFAHRVTIIESIRALGNFFAVGFSAGTDPKENSARKSIHQFAQPLLSGLKNRHTIANQ